MSGEIVRILQVVGTLNIGGAETMIMNLYRAIDRNIVQFDFIVHTIEKGDYDDEIDLLGGRIYRFEEIKSNTVRGLIKKWNDFFLLHSEYKILHSHIRSYASIYLPIAKKNGLVTIAHSHSTSNGSGFKSFVKALLQYPIRFQADYLMACSKEAGEWLFGKKACKNKNFMVFRNAIDSKKFEYDLDKRKDIREKLKIEDNCTVIGHVGNFLYSKNHFFLVKVYSKFVSRFPNSKLLLIGDGVLKDSVYSLSKDIGISDHIIFVGKTEEVELYYQAMDVFVFPSLWEGLGMAVVEAQASGLPCIISENIPGLSNIGASLINVVSLEEPLIVWASKIESLLKTERMNTSSIVKKSGYDIAENAIFIQEFYLKTIKKD